MSGHALRWRKGGRLYVADGHAPWAAAYAFPPTPWRLPGTDLVRVFVGFCDEHTVGRVGYVDLAREGAALRVVGVSPQPVLDVGVPGAFDDNGVVPTCALEVEGRLFLYYVGFQLGVRQRYFQFQGLAVSEDGGESFTRAQRVPVIDRSDTELLHRTSGHVRRGPSGGFELFYVAGDQWTTVGEKSLPIYDIRRIESDDGRTWPDRGVVVVSFENDDEHAFGRPWPAWIDGREHLFYSVRTRSKDYRIGVAVRRDDGTWERRDRDVGIDVSTDGWDSEMIAYAAVLDWGGETFMLYCGNGCGRTGFGYATLDRSGSGDDR